MAKHLAPEPEPPQVLALLLCERIIQDKNGPYSLINLYYGQILTPSFPLRLPSLEAFALLTGMTRPAKGRFRIVRDGDDLQVLETAEFEVPVNDPLSPVTITAPLPAINFMGRGQHALELYIDGGLVERSRFHLDVRSAGG